MRNKFDPHLTRWPADCELCVCVGEVFVLDFLRKEVMGAPVEGDHADRWSARGPVALLSTSPKAPAMGERIPFSLLTAPTTGERCRSCACDHQSSAGTAE